ncbi:hypothetical protein BLOT_012197 [Blomia tropicalis]|nr:hypothetical protein BLOT_012197 [Blomia tropicalis]
MDTSALAWHGYVWANCDYLICNYTALQCVQTSIFFIMCTIVLTIVNAVSNQQQFNVLLDSIFMSLKAKIVMEKGPNALSNFKVCFHYCPNLNFKTKALKEKDLK